MIAPANALRWSGTFTGICGAMLISLNISGSEYGFLLFTLSSLCWLVVGLQIREPSIWSMQLVFTGINLIGVVRWI